MGKKKLFLHRRTMKKINIALCTVIALLVVTTMFLLMKRKEALIQTDSARQTYEDTAQKYSYEGLLKQDAELQSQIDGLNSEINEKNGEINDFNEMITKAKNREYAANKYSELAEMYRKLLNNGQ